MTRSRQVSHGLNLVLKLRTDVAMRDVLVQIKQAQSKIDAGLDELGFVHFARFLPTHDNTALQVVTEFDGPLAPYVLDFAIEIGDVFDMLLRHTQGTEHLVPIAEHPAEFLAFVVENNTVSVPGLPPMPELNLYSAYRDTTVLEIVGPRSELPAPKADRATSRVQDWDIQGNVLRGYRAERATHFLLKISDATAARAWISERTTATPTLPAVTSGAPWPEDAKPSLMLNLGITAAGLSMLIAPKWLAPFPQAFQEGADKRAKDNFDTGSNDPALWWLGGKDVAQDIHLMVSLYQRTKADSDAFAAAAAALRNSLMPGGLELLDEQDVEQLDGRSRLGYADGIAEPRVAGIHEPERTDLQPASTAGEFLLGAEYKNIYGGSSLGPLPVVLASNGTFCAVRILAQDATVFRDALRSEAARLGVPSDWLAAKVMGRWMDGAPISLHPERPPKDVAENRRNDFDYAPSHEFPSTPMDHAGLRCPVGAHIRRVNARSSRIAGARYTRRLMRRGMHYTRKVADTVEYGLFGLFMCADLERQFEFIQREWINGDRFAPGLRGTRDLFAGTPDGQHEFEIPMAHAPALRLRLPQFVFTRGSLYLFMPGLNALRSLADFADSAPSPAGAGASSQLQPVTPATMNAGQNKELNMSIHAKAVNELTSDQRTRIGLASVGKRQIAAPLATSAAPPPPAPEFDTKDPAFWKDPYPVFAKFRQQAPLYRAPPPFDGWFIFRYEDVRRVCDEDDNFSADVIGATAERGLFQMDEPPHGQVRNLIASAWMTGASNAKVMVEKSIAAAVTSLQNRQTFDLVDDFARGVPREVFFDILGGAGITPQARLDLDALARMVMKHHDHTLDRVQSAPGVEAGRALAKELGLLLQAAGTNPQFKGSFLAHLAPLVGPGPLTPVVAISSLVSMTVAGYMSVEFLLATGIRQLLLDDGAWWKQVQADRGLLPACLEEMRRREHALSVIDRFAKREVSFGDVRIDKGERVYGVLASANRDELVYGVDADEFRPGRLLPKPHLGFGHGTHECLGRHLQMLIAEPAIRALIDNKSGLRIETGKEPVWFENFYFRSFDHLAVTT